MQVRLTKPELERFVNEQVAAGSYATAADVIEAGLERLMSDPEVAEVEAETLAAIERAEAEFDRGEDRPFAEVAAELRAKYNLGSR